MIETIQIKAIILSRRYIRENDSQVVLFSDQRGKLELVARGTGKTSSKLSAHIEPLNFSNIMLVRGRKLDYIGAAASQQCYPGIKNDLDCLIYSGKALNIFNRLVKYEDKDPALFSLLKNFLGSLDKTSGPGSKLIKKEILYISFLAKLVSLLGYKPELFNCISCNTRITPEKIFFDISRGGLICQACKSATQNGNLVIPISQNCVKFLRLCSTEDFRNLIKLDIKNSLKNEINYFVELFVNNIGEKLI